MIEAFARSAEGVAQILCINRSRCLTTGGFRRPHIWHEWLRCGNVRRLSTNLYLLTPTFWVPLCLRFGIRDVNNSRREIVKQVNGELERLGMNKERRVVWIHRPEQIGWLGLIGEQHVLYECYDEYQLDRRTGDSIPGIKELEKTLLKKADVVFTVSRSLFERRSQWHPKVYFVPNGADVELFSKAFDDSTPIAPELTEIKRPIIGYIGSLDPSIDYQLLEYIADTRPDWSIVLVGQIEMKKSVENLKRKQNVHFLGWVPYEQLPYYSKGFDVFFLPCRVNSYYQFSDPLKIWEQLAAGNVVVSADLKEVRRLKDIVIIARDKAEFVYGIEMALSGNNEERMKRGINAARERSWDVITRNAVKILEKEFAE